MLPPWLLRHTSTLKGCRHSSPRTYHPPTSKLLPEYIPVAFPPWVGASRNTEVSKLPDFWTGRVKPIHFAACWLDAQSRAVLFVLTSKSAASFSPVTPLGREAQQLEEVGCAVRERLITAVSESLQRALHDLPCLQASGPEQSSGGLTAGTSTTTGNASAFVLPHFTSHTPACTHLRPAWPGAPSSSSAPHLRARSSAV